MNLFCVKACFYFLSINAFEISVWKKLGLRVLMICKTIRGKVFTYVEKKLSVDYLSFSHVW